MKCQSLFSGLTGKIETICINVKALFPGEVKKKKYLKMSSAETFFPVC